MPRKIKIEGVAYNSIFVTDNMSVPRDYLYHYYEQYMKYLEKYASDRSELDDWLVCSLKPNLVDRYNMGFVYMKIQEQEQRMANLEAENAKLRTELKETDKSKIQVNNYENNIEALNNVSLDLNMLENYRIKFEKDLTISDGWKELLGKEDENFMSNRLGNNGYHWNSQHWDIARKLRINRLGLGFMYMKFQEQEVKFNKQEERIATLEAENAKLRTEFKEVLSALSVKKPVGEEIAELQERIMKLYAEQNNT